VAMLPRSHPEHVGGVIRTVNSATDLWLWCGDERTRTADPLLAKQGQVNSLTSGFVSSEGHEHDWGEVERGQVHQ